MAATRDNAERFTLEARLLAQLHHPAIVGYLAHGTTDDGLYLAMEWLEGEDLSARLLRERLSLDEALTLGRCVAEALAAAHARAVVHRDLKPSNLFLPRGRIDHVKVLDFGIARWAFASNVVTRPGSFVGTPAYMAPEQTQGRNDIDGRADLFSLGCVLFQCLSGRPPFFADHVIALLAKVMFEEAPRVRELRPDLPAALDDLVARLLAKDPAGRPRDAAAVVAELNEVARDTEITSQRVPSLARLTSSEQRARLRGAGQRSQLGHPLGPCTRRALATADDGASARHRCRAAGSRGTTRRRISAARRRDGDRAFGRWIRSLPIWRSMRRAAPSRSVRSFPQPGWPSRPGAQQ